MLTSTVPSHSYVKSHKSRPPSPDPPTSLCLAQRLHFRASLSLTSPSASLLFPPPPPPPRTGALRTLPERRDTCNLLPSWKGLTVLSRRGEGGGGREGREVRRGGWLTRLRQRCNINSEKSKISLASASSFAASKQSALGHLDLLAGVSTLFTRGPHGVWWSLRGT